MEKGISLGNEWKIPSCWSHAIACLSSKCNRSIFTEAKWKSSSTLAHWNCLKSRRMSRERAKMIFEPIGLFFWIFYAQFIFASPLFSSLFNVPNWKTIKPIYLDWTRGMMVRQKIFAKQCLHFRLWRQPRTFTRLEPSIRSLAHFWSFETKNSSILCATP